MPQLLPQAQELAKQSDPRTTEYRDQLRVLAKPITDTAGLDCLIVDSDKDLANCTRQTLAAGGEPAVMEWWRHGVGQTDIGAFALSLDVAAYFGMKSISILDHQRPNPNGTPEQQELEAKNPKGVFRTVFDELSAAAKIDPQWNAFIKVYKQNNQGAVRPSRLGLVQAFLYEQNGKTATQPVYCLFMFNAMTLKSLEAQWNMPQGGMGTMPTDWLNGFQCGNLLDPMNGCMILAYDQNAMASQSGTFGQAFGQSAGGGGGNRTNYVAQLQPGQPLPDATSIEYFRQWDSFLNIPTREEAWMHVFKCMGPHATAFAGRNEIALLPDTIRQMAAEFAAGGATPPTPPPVPMGSPPPQLNAGGAAPAGFGPPAAAAPPATAAAPPAAAPAPFAPPASPPAGPPGAPATPASAPEIPGAPASPGFAVGGAQPAPATAAEGTMVPPAPPSADDQPAVTAPGPDQDAVTAAVHSLGDDLGGAHGGQATPPPAAGAAAAEPSGAGPFGPPPAG